MSKKNKSKQFQNLRKQAEFHLAHYKQVIPERMRDVHELLHELSVHQTELEIQNEDLLLIQAEIEASRNQYVELYEFAPVSYLTLDNMYSIMSCNFSAVELLGLERPYFYKKNFQEFIAINSKEAFFAHIQKLFATKIKQSCELELVKKDQEKCYILLESTISQNKQILVSLTDITQNKQIELKLKESNHSLCLINNLFQSASDAIAALDAEFKFTVFNQAFERIFFTLFKLTIVKGMNFLNIISELPKQQSNIVANYRQALANKNLSITHEIKSDNSTHYYEASFNLIANENANLIGLAYLIRDVTAHKLKEQTDYKRRAEIAYVARMNSMGEMASAIAHEINQPLTVINTYNHGCMLSLEKGISEAQQLLRTLGEINLQTEHAGNVIHRMKNFMREGKMYYQETNINTLIRDTFILFNYELIEAKILLHFDLSATLNTIYCDQVQIQQVILNLVRNSIESLRGASILQPQITIRTYQHNQLVEIDIIDNGPGIPLELMDKVLNSYFTTKPQGTGLGLAICRTLIESHGGKLFIKANPTGGTWAQFNLPFTSGHTYADT